MRGAAAPVPMSRTVNTRGALSEASQRAALEAQLQVCAQRNAAPRTRASAAGLISRWIHVRAVPPQAVASRLQTLKRERAMVERTLVHGPSNAARKLSKAATSVRLRARFARRMQYDVVEEQGEGVEGGATPISRMRRCSAASAGNAEGGADDDWLDSSEVARDQAERRALTEAGLTEGGAEEEEEEDDVGGGGGGGGAIAARFAATIAALRLKRQHSSANVKAGAGGAGGHRSSGGKRAASRLAVSSGAASDADNDGTASRASDAGGAAKRAVKQRWRNAVTVAAANARSDRNDAVRARSVLHHALRLKRIPWPLVVTLRHAIMLADAAAREWIKPGAVSCTSVHARAHAPRPLTRAPTRSATGSLRRTGFGHSVAVLPLPRSHSAMQHASAEEASGQAAQNPHGVMDAHVARWLARSLGLLLGAPGATPADSSGGRQGSGSAGGDGSGVADGDDTMASLQEADLAFPHWAFEHCLRQLRWATCVRVLRRAVC